MDKQDFDFSLSQMEDRIERFVQRFYYFFLQTEAGELFKNTEMKTHFKMFM